MMSNQEIREKIRSIVGTVPNSIFEYLELSQTIREDWHKGNKASDFGYHKIFVTKCSNQLVDLFISELQKAVREARIAENTMYLTERDRHYFSSPDERHIPLVQFEERIKELKAVKIGVSVCF